MSTSVVASSPGFRARFPHPVSWYLAFWYLAVQHQEPGALGLLGTSDVSVSRNPDPDP
jgi:hypothetical protein